MKAIIYSQYGDPSVLRQADQPVPQPRAGEVQVRVNYAALNPVDCEIRKGRISLLTGWRFPRIPGSDFAGIVSACGPDVTQFSPGDAVYGFTSPLRGGAYAEYLTIPVGRIARIPEGCTFAQAASLPLAALTALQGMRDCGHLKPGGSVFIHGASGGVGTLAVQIAKALGATVHASCSYRNTAAVAALGADEVFDYTQTNIRQLGRTYDLFFDVYGNMPLSRVWHQVAKEGAHVTTIPTPDNYLQAWNPFRKRQTKVVVVNSKTADLEWLNAQWEAGKLHSVIDRKYPLAEAQNAQEYQESRRAKGKICLHINSSETQ